MLSFISDHNFLKCVKKLFLNHLCYIKYPWMYGCLVLLCQVEFVSSLWMIRQLQLKQPKMHKTVTLHKLYSTYRLSCSLLKSFHQLQNTISLSCTKIVYLAKKETTFLWKLEFIQLISINPVAQLIGDEGRYGFNPLQFWVLVKCCPVVKGVYLKDVKLFIVAIRTRFMFHNPCG